MGRDAYACTSPWARARVWTSVHAMAPPDRVLRSVRQIRAEIRSSVTGIVDPPKRSDSTEGTEGTGGPRAVHGAKIPTAGAGYTGLRQSGSLRRGRIRFDTVTVGIDGEGCIAVGILVPTNPRRAAIGAAGSKSGGMEGGHIGAGRCIESEVQARARMRSYRRIGLAKPKHHAARNSGHSTQAADDQRRRTLGDGAVGQPCRALASAASEGQREAVCAACARS